MVRHTTISKTVWHSFLSASCSYYTTLGLTQISDSSLAFPSKEILSYQTNISTPLCTMAPVLLRLEDPIEHSIVIRLRPCGKSWSTFTSEGDCGTGGGAVSRGKRIYRRRRSTHHWDIWTSRQRHRHYAWVTKSGSRAVTYLWQGTR